MDNFCESATFLHDLHFKMFGKNLSLWIKVTARLYHKLFATIKVSTSVCNIYHYLDKAKWYIHPKFGITTDNIEGVMVLTCDNWWQFFNSFNRKTNRSPLNPSWKVLKLEGRAEVANLFCLDVSLIASHLTSSHTYTLACWAKVQLSSSKWAHLNC